MSGFFTPARILDLVILALLIWMVVRYYRDGLIAGLMAFCGTLVSMGGAWWAAKELSPLLFEKLFSENLISRTANAISTSEGVITVNELLSKISGFLPKNIIDTFLSGTGAETFDLAAPDIAQRIVTEVVQPLVSPVISILLFFAVFIVCRIIVNFIVTALKGINRIPVIGTANRVLGVISGLLLGLLYAFLIVCAVWALIVITGGDMAFLTEEAIGESVFYKLLSGFIPFE